MDEKNNAEIVMMTTNWKHSRQIEGRTDLKATFAQKTDHEIDVKQ